MSDRPRVFALGAHILDVLVRPVEAIPEGQGGVLVEQIRVGPAGAAGGTAVTLAKLGCETLSAGAIGNDDLGALLRGALERFGVDTAHLLGRDEDQTSATVLPIRPNGDRPALHVIGANASYTRDDVPFDAIAAADWIHMGGPEFLGPELAGEILLHARTNGTGTSVDVLADGWAEMMEWLGPVWPSVDVAFPNREQLALMTGETDVETGARALLERGTAVAAVTCGEEGSVIVPEGGEAVAVPARSVEVVDTTGCGDAFAAGFIRGRTLALDLRESAELGTACAAFVAGGLGSDAGDFDLEAVRA